MGFTGFTGAPLRVSARAARRVALWLAGSALGTVTGVVTKEPLIALTFDDGPDPEYTPRLLEILERYGARATFFMTGEAANAHPELVRRIAQAGHAIGNHSWDHPSFPLISGRERRAQIRACARAIAPYGERLFRPPYGEQTIASWCDAFLLRHRVVMFDCWSDDWRGGDAATIARQLEKRARPGGIVILHDRLWDALDRAYFNREPMLEGLEIFLRRSLGRFRFVTVSELLRRGKARKEFWRKRPDRKLLNELMLPDGPARRYGPRGAGQRRG
ncbi:MAG TPA: polysaccharide deacetylase family protein [Candidatus Acidoferrales bacterium]|nr:polysaccharide deacetylase family protein [Candidatus Acidoferrales bacterium]